MRDPLETTPSTTPTAWVAPGWTCFVVGVDGAPASAVALDMEIFINYEINLADDNVMAQMATSAPVDQPYITSAINEVSSEGINIVVGGAKEFAKNVVSSAARALVRAGTTYFGGGLAAGASMLLT